MKKISLLLILFIAVAISFNSCKKDTFTEADAIKLINDRNDQNDILNDSLQKVKDEIGYLRTDSINKANSRVYLNIHVIDASNNFVNKSTKGEKALSGATVNVATESGIQTVTTDAAGLASFEIIKGGTYAITVSAADYTTLDLQTAYINSGGYYSLQTPLLSLTNNRMTVSGTITYEADLTNAGREVCPNAIVRVTPNFNNFGMTNINSYTYSGFPTTATTAADGTYSIPMPADAAGQLYYSLTVDDYTANQVLLANTVNGANTSGSGFGSQTVPAFFAAGSNASTIPNVDPVYAIFSAPTHTITAAVLAATIGGNYGVDYVVDNSAGYGYHSGVQIYLPNTNGTAAVVEPAVNGNGEILDWVVNTTGSDFTAAPSIPLGFTNRAATALTFNDANTDGIIDNGELSIPTAADGGLYLTDNLVFSIAGAGTGADITFTFTNATDSLGHGSYRRINGITVTNGGSGYVDGSVVHATVASSNVVATATAVLQTSSVTSVSVTSGGSGYPASTTMDVLFTGGGGSGADYEVTTNTQGVVINATENTSQGSNYTTAPTATVDYTFTPETADYNVSVSSANVVSVTAATGGAGYDAVPTLTFYYQATADLAVSDLIYTVNISATDPWNVSGVSFTQNKLTSLARNISSSVNSNTSASTIYAKVGETIMRNFYLGTGTRTNVN